MKYNLFLLLLLTFSCNSLKNKPLEKSLKSAINPILNNNNFNGVVLIAQDTNIIYSKAMGFSDLEAKTPLLLSDQFVIGSISKQITAVLVLRAFEKGKIDLNDKIYKFLTTLEQPWAKTVTIHHLLTHTHGIVDLEKPLAFEPGTSFQYSQLGYELLARILEALNNKSFEAIATDFFEAQGLINTYHPNHKIYKNLVKGYEEQENGTLAFSENSLENYAAAGSFIANAKDLIKWNKLLHTGKLVQQETLDLMKIPYATRNHPIFDQVKYGYGLLFKDKEQGIEIGALGYAPGFASACYYYPLTDRQVIVLENTAWHLDDFKKTFQVHTYIMKLVKDMKGSK